MENLVFHPQQRSSGRLRKTLSSIYKKRSSGRHGKSYLPFIKKQSSRRFENLIKSFSEGTPGMGKISLRSFKQYWFSPRRGVLNGSYISIYTLLRFHSTRLGDVRIDLGGRMINLRDVMFRAARGTHGQYINGEAFKVFSRKQQASNSGGKMP